MTESDDATEQGMGLLGFDEESKASASEVKLEPQTEEQKAASQVVAFKSNVKQWLRRFQDAEVVIVEAMSTAKSRQYMEGLIADLTAHLKNNRRVIKHLNECLVAMPPDAAVMKLLVAMANCQSDQEKYYKLCQDFNIAPSRASKRTRRSETHKSGGD